MKSQGSRTFLLFGSSLCSLVLCLHVWVNVFSDNSNLIILVDVQNLHRNKYEYVFLTGVILCLKNVLAVSPCFIKMFHLQHRLDIIDFPCWNDSCRTKNKGCKSFFPFTLNTTYPQEKSNHKKSHVYLTDSQYSTRLLNKCSLLQHLSLSRHLKACKRPDFFWLISLVSSPPSMTTLRFPHASLMNATLSKSSKFPLCHLYQYHPVLPQI